MGAAITHYSISAIIQDSPKTESLQSVRTRPDAFSPEKQGLLINRGYALADTVIRLLPFPPAATHWPVSAFPL